MFFKCIVLAAGKSTRLKLSHSKVLLEIMGKCVIDRILEQLTRLPFLDEIIVVVGFDKEKVEEKVKKYSVTIIEQKQQKGTLDAVKVCSEHLGNYSGNVLVLNGDLPLVEADELKQFLSNFRKDIRIGITVLDNPQGYGRIIRNQNGQITRIVEEAQATEFERAIKEVNTGIYCFNWPKVRTLFNKVNKLKNNEYYLTDLIEVAYQHNLRIDSYILPAECSLGINTWEDFARVCEIQRKRIIVKYLAEGVKIPFPSSVYIEEDVVIEAGSTIAPFTVIEKNVRIGSRCIVGPFARLRAGTRLDEGVIIGNFMELKNTVMGKDSKARHLSYLGDAIIGKNVNIGAGTITANYDGKNHNTTIIEDNVTTGSGTVLIAPVKMGKNSQTGAGAVVTKHHNVAENEIVVGIPAHPLKSKAKTQNRQKQKK
ncbi:MAG: bifunctional N-acetylglucosamine-1-phosphate uridyltransferase/glucosamine-1-phosphate acetyltransferase [Planctomycetota bacterium]